MTRTQIATMVGSTMSERDDNSHVYALGAYYPRSHREHRSSLLSRAILRVKNCSQREIDYFAKVIARFLDGWLPHTGPHIITHVPGMRMPDDICACRRLALAIHKHMDPNEWVEVRSLLTERRHKERLQRSCKTTLERIHNVADCYRVTAHISGCNVILIDDVVTTGATMSECVGALRLAGAKTITGMALARTVSSCPTLS